MTGNQVKIRFVFDGPIDEDDAESVRVAGTEIIADFPEPWTIDDQIVRLDYPADLRTDALQDWVYERKEKTTEGRPLR